MKNFIFSAKSLLLIFIVSFSVSNARATGEPSTYFNIYLSPNNDRVKRDVCLIVTALYDSTSFEIIDDGEDGDTDDSVSGVLMAGQSYVLYIRDNGVNDDADRASNGVLKQDGDYLIVKSNKLVYASQSTNSDWQHDWIPSTNKTGVGQKFIVYAPKTSSSKRDINVFAYENNTEVTVKKISLSTTTNTGYTDVDYFSRDIVIQKNLDVGEDLIYKNSEGRNLMSSGETYLIETNKAVTVQYGALYGNERDGGGYVPSEDGSSSGDLFFFGVPYQSRGEQEIRMISLDDNNFISLERYEDASWVPVKSWTANKNEVVDWVGKNEGNVSHATVFKVTCSATKKVIVFEANWLETGNPGTSDFVTACSSLTGNSAGKDFLVYMAPPGNQSNVKDPFTGNYFGQKLTHLYLFASDDTCHVNVKDTYTDGTKINRTITILPNRYADCYFTLAEWKSIYNGTGKVSDGPERPYVTVTSDNKISVVNSNANDNWMMYFGSSLEQNYSLSSSYNDNIGVPGDTIEVVSTLHFNGSEDIDSAMAHVNAGDGFRILSCKLIDETVDSEIDGQIEIKDFKTDVSFPMQLKLHNSHVYKVVSRFVLQTMYNNGDPIGVNIVIGIETNISGKVKGKKEHGSITQGIKVISSNTSRLLFSRMPFSGELTDSWTSNTIDIDGDGWDDIFVNNKNKNISNYYYKNRGNNVFTLEDLGELTSKRSTTISSTWADYNNDGFNDALLTNNTSKTNHMFKGKANVEFDEESNTPITKEIAYYHNGSFADYDNDGNLDVLITNYFETKFNEVYHNNGDGTFTKIEVGDLASESVTSLGASWADYDNDGDQDVFISNVGNDNNSLFVNQGNGNFAKLTSSIVCNEGGNSIGSSWGDINNDGWLDLYVTNASNQKNFLYLNDKNGDFTKVTVGSAANDKGHSHGSAFIDLDNDMDLDLYVTNDQGKKHLYLNDGTGNFDRYEDELLESNYGKSMGQSWFDFDNDGDLDVFVTTHSDNKNHLFVNNGNSNNHIKVKLIGTVSNKSAVGARIKVYGGNKRQIREVNSQTSIGGQSSYFNHFGLGKSTIDSVVVLWPSGLIQTITDLTLNAKNTITEPNGALVHGKVFLDDNTNCSIDAGEYNISNVKVSFSNGQFTYTNGDGEFSTYLQTGTYTSTFENQGNWASSCSDETFTISSNNDVKEINIPIEASIAGINLNVDLSLTAMRRGFKNLMKINVGNSGTETAYNVPVKFTLGSGMVVAQCIPFYNSINANEYTWTFDSIQPGQSITINIQDSVLLSKVIGDPLVFNVEVIEASDVDNSDNQAHEVAEVVGAIDPNDLLVSPKGLSESGYIRETEELTYTIRFQNIGNFYASNVTLLDQLPKELNLRTLKDVKSSHDFTFNVSSDGLFTAYFRNINLPDSSTNEELSNGFISFTISMNDDLLEGTEIINEAKIQFDYEDFIETNKVRNTLVYQLVKDELVVYPNPTTSNLNFQLLSSDGRYQEDKDIKSIRLFDAMGNFVKDVEKGEGSVNEVDLSEFKSGVYFICIEVSDTEKYFKRVVLAK